MVRLTRVVERRGEEGHWLTILCILYSSELSSLLALLELLGEEAPMEVRSLPSKV